MVQGAALHGEQAPWMKHAEQWKNPSLIERMTLWSWLQHTTSRRACEWQQRRHHQAIKLRTVVMDHSWRGWWCSPAALHTSACSCTPAGPKGRRGWPGAGRGGNIGGAAGGRRRLQRLHWRTRLILRGGSKQGAPSVGNTLRAGRRGRASHLWPRSERYILGCEATPWVMYLAGGPAEAMELCKREPVVMAAAEGADNVMHVLCGHVQAHPVCVCTCVRASERH